MSDGLPGACLYVCSRKIPALCRHNPLLFLRILTTYGASREEFVLKVAPATTQFKREGRVYQALAREPGVVSCVFAGAVRFLDGPSGGSALDGIRVHGRPVVLPRDVVRTMRRHFQATGQLTRRLFAVMTRYDTGVVSIPCHLRKGYPAPTDFTTRAVELVRGLNRRLGFAHWDLHSHNMLVDRASGDPILLDMDLASVAGDVGPVAQILPVAPYVGLLREIVGHGDGPESGPRSENDLGHRYDLAMLFTAHRHVFGSVRISRSTPAGRRSWEAYARFEAARGLLRKVDWLALGRSLLARTPGMTRPSDARARSAEIEGHLRLLFVATAMCALESGCAEEHVLDVTRGTIRAEESLRDGITTPGEHKPCASPPIPTTPGAHEETHRE